MAVDIDCVVQTKVSGAWRTVEIPHERHPIPPLYRNRAMFALLASAGMEIGGPESPFGDRRGLPLDDPSLADTFPLAVPDPDDPIISAQTMASWLLSEELLNFNYDTPIEILIPPRERSPREPLKPGEGRQTTWREYVGAREVERFLARLRESGPATEVRLVFAFSW